MSSKHQALQSVVHATVDLSDEQQLSSPAVLLRFPYGPPAQLTASGHEHRALTAVLYSNSDKRKRHQRSVLCNTDSVLYRGINYGDDSYKLNTQQYSVGVYNTKTQTLRLHDTTHVYNMHQHMKSALDGSIMPVAATASNSSSNNINDDDDAATRSAKLSAQYIQDRENLIDTYGSKKRRREIKSQAANKVTMQQQVADVLDHTLNATHQDTSAVKKEAGISSDSEATAAATTADPGLAALKLLTLPPHNDRTTNVFEIYDKFTMISADEWDALPSSLILNSANNSNSSINKRYTAFIQHRIVLLSTTEHDKSESKIKAKLLLYTDILLRFATMSPASKQKSLQALAQSEAYATGTEHYSVHSEVQQRLLREFCEATEQQSSKGDGVMYTSYKQSLSMKSKTLCWLCVLALMICDYSLDGRDIELMAADLKVTSQALLLYFKEVGATTSKDRVKLNAPLQLPSLKGKARAKR